MTGRAGDSSVVETLPGMSGVLVLPLALHPTPSKTVHDPPSELADAGHAPGIISTQRPTLGRGRADQGHIAGSDLFAMEQVKARGGARPRQVLAGFLSALLAPGSSLGTWQPPEFMLMPTLLLTPPRSGRSQDGPRGSGRGVSCACV